MSTREAILTAATDLVQTVGANAMSFQDLAERTRIRKASVHHHFPTKAHLLEAVIESYSQGYFARVAQITASNAPAFERLAAVVGLYADTCARDGGGRRACVVGMLGSEAESLTERGRALLAEFVTRNQRAILDLIEAGQADGSIRPPPDPAGFARGLIAALQGGLVLARVAGGPEFFSSVIGPMLASVRAAGS